MKKLLQFVLSAFLLSAGTASAQFNYDFTVQNGQTYTPLIGTPLNGTTPYDDAFFLIPMPFTAQIDRQPMDSMWLLRESVFFNDLTQQFASGFNFMDADLADKGSFDTVSASPVSLSPVRTAVTGTAPNRIFKVEYANMGFYEEFFTYGTINDSANIQIWVYEGSNIVELRYGPSHVTNFYDYFDQLGMQVGLLHDIDIQNGGYGSLYYLSGNPAAPVIDSIDLSSPSVPSQLLTSYPANGTVYRFTPKALGIGAVTGNVALNVFPTATRDLLNVTYGDAAAAEYSIVSATGASLQRGSLQTGRNSLDVSALAPGSYTLQARSAAGHGTFRFTKM